MKRRGAALGGCRAEGHPHSWWEQKLVPPLSKLLGKTR